MTESPERAAWRAFEVELLVVAETLRVATYSEPREDVPFEFLQQRVGARLTVALIGWLDRRHPRVTIDDREGPSAWTNAPLGTVLVGDAPTGVAEVPEQDDVVLAAFDGLGYSYAERVRAIRQEYARWADEWNSMSEADLRRRRDHSLGQIGAVLRRIDEWKAGKR